MSEADRNLICSEFILKLLHSPPDPADLETERSYRKFLTEDLGLLYKDCLQGKTNALSSWIWLTNQYSDGTYRFDHACSRGGYPWMARWSQYYRAKPGSGMRRIITRAWKCHRRTMCCSNDSLWSRSLRGFTRPNHQYYNTILWQGTPPHKDLAERKRLLSLMESRRESKIEEFADAKFLQNLDTSGQDFNDGPRRPRTRSSIYGKAGGLSLNISAWWKEKEASRKNLSSYISNFVTTEQESGKENPEQQIWITRAFLA